MKIDKVVSIYRKCGFKITKIDGCYFLDRGLLTYSFPQYIDMPINDNLINSLKWKHPISIIKTQSRIKNSYEFVLETNNYGIEKFSTKKRYYIRKSLKEYTFGRPSLEDLLEAGLKINQKAMAKHGRQDKFLTESRHWRNYITSFYSQENILIIGAYIAGKMIGYITVIKIEGSYYIIDPYFDFECSLSSPMPGMIFTLVNRIIEENGSIKICYGLESFNPLPGLNWYKHSMLFQRIPATRVYVLNPLLTSFLRIIVFLYIKVLKYKSIKNPLIRRVIRLYNGTRILTKSKK